MPLRIEIRRDIGFIYQAHNLFESLTAIENVMMAQYFHSMTNEQEALQLLTRVGMANRAQR